MNTELKKAKNKVEKDFFRLQIMTHLEKQEKCEKTHRL